VTPPYVEPAPAWSGLEQVAAIVHDMKTPLATITTSAELLELDLDAEDSAHFISIIRRQACRLQRMVEDLAASMRTPQVEVTLGCETVDLTKFIHELAAESWRMVGSHSLRLDLPPARVPASVDVEKVRRIFENLIRNALQYSPNDTTITIGLRVDAQAGRAVLRVEDEGPGVPESAREEIFKPFVRLQPQHSRSGEGLGLYIVRRFAVAHGGEAWVEDGAVGARFCVVLPTVAPVSDL
jgi:signal transduction histidine kinase